MQRLMVMKRKAVQRQLMEMKKMEMPSKNLRWRMKLKRTKQQFYVCIITALVRAGLECLSGGLLEGVI